MLSIRVNEVEARAKLDHLSETKEFAEVAGKAIARPVTFTLNLLVHPVDTITFVSGRLTRLAQKELTERGWKVFESFTSAAGH